MKKLLLALLVVSSLAYADDCSDKATQAVAKLHKYNKTAIQLNYTGDKSAFADMCEADIKALDSKITVIKKPILGGSTTGQFKMSKPD